MAKENITEEEELVEDFGDGYFAPYQQVFGVSWAFGVSEVLGYFWFFLLRIRRYIGYLCISDILGYFVPYQQVFWIF